MRTWVALAVLVGVVALSRRSLLPPRVSPERAETLRATHRELFTDTPRPTGSPEAAAARARIRRALDEAGCATSEQTAWSCGKRGCALATNVWCRLGPDTGAPILGMAHTDSVAAGPGAADDGAGVVAWVDTVRGLRGVPLTRPLVLALTDAEEPGLLGARAWFADPPVREAPFAVVNLEARGTTGASFLFQTVGPARPWGTWAATLPTEPRASSLYPTVYGWIPNDTDLSVAARYQHAGVNHAFLGELSHYHTVRDDLDHLDPASLAHHADLAAGWVRALQDPPDADPTVFTDLFGLALVRWPTSLARGLTGAAALALAGIGAVDLRRGRWTARDAALAAAAAFGALLATAVAAEALGAALRATGRATWSWPDAVGLVAGGFAAAAFTALGRVATPGARWAVAVGAMSVVALGGAALSPGLTVLGLVGLTLAAFARVLPEPWTYGGALVGAAVTATPLAFGLPVVLGADRPLVAALPWALVFVGASPFAPERPGRWVAALAAMSLAGAVALGLAPDNPERPWPVNVVWDDTAGQLLRTDERAGVTTSTPVERRGFPAPSAEWVGPATLRVVPARGGRLEIATDTPYTMAGQAAPSDRTTWWGLPAEGVDFVFAERPRDLRIDEVVPGLPDGVEAGRSPAEAAVHKGDGTRVRIEPR